MRKAKILLTELIERFPPGDGAPHRIELGDADMPLVITLFLPGGIYQKVGLEEYDLDCSISEIVFECERVVEEMKDKHKGLRSAKS